MCALLLPRMRKQLARLAADRADSRDEPASAGRGPGHALMLLPGGALVDRFGALAVLCLARGRGVQRVEHDVLVVSIDRLTPALRTAAGPRVRPAFLPGSPATEQECSHNVDAAVPLGAVNRRFEFVCPRADRPAADRRSLCRPQRRPKLRRYPEFLDPMVTGRLPVAAVRSPRASTCRADGSGRRTGRSRPACERSCWPRGDSRR